MPNDSPNVQQYTEKVYTLNESQTIWKTHTRLQISVSYEIWTSDLKTETSDLQKSQGMDGTASGRINQMHFGQLDWCGIKATTNWVG